MANKPIKPKKVDVVFCWECSRKLSTSPKGGFAFKEVMVDGHMRKLHHVCAMKYTQARKETAESIKSGVTKKHGVWKQ